MDGDRSPALREMSLEHNDDTALLASAVREAYEQAAPVEIVAGGTRRAFGRAPIGTPLSVARHAGIVAYDPSEFVVTVRAGTPITALEEILAREGQVLTADVPRFGAASTIGGALAVGLTGPGRPYSGALRDAVLGVRLISGTGEVVRFGGQVLKNVAGFDVSRLMAGAYGTLGLLLDVSLRTARRPEAQEVVRLEQSWPAARVALRQWESALPLTGACYADGVLHVRLAGLAPRVAEARRVIGGETGDMAVFTDMRDLRGTFFERPGDLWRLLVPPESPWDPEDTVIDWAGAQRFWRVVGDATVVYELAARLRGQAMRLVGADRSVGPWALPPPATMALMARVKAAMDPRGILNRGRLYPDW
ncbi:glycolate oxidase subunit GlcE [Acidiferrobacter sp.]